MNRKSLFLLSFIAVAGVGLASCDDNDFNRSVITVASINENGPFFSDVIDSNNVVHEDYVAVMIQNRPYNVFVTTGPDLPYSDFVVTRYRVEWRRVDGGVGVPATYEGATSMSIPSGDMVAGSILLVPAIEKLTPLMTALYGGGEYVMVAMITFWGHEGGVERETEFQASLTVTFANSSD
jgi:hypothetical protein